MARTKIPMIRPVEGYLDMNNDDLLKRSMNVVDGVGTNTAVFTAPPVAPADLKAQNETFSALMAESADGSKKIIAQTKKIRHGIVKDLRVLGRYVEKIADGDMVTFRLSGFEPVTTVRTLQAPLSLNFRSIDHGTISGQFLVRMKAVPGAVTYDLRYAALANGTPGVWTIQVITTVRSPILLNGLTPGTLYAFQARSLDKKKGSSDWSDSFTMMCT